LKARGTRPILIERLLEDALLWAYLLTTLDDQVKTLKQAAMAIREHQILQSEVENPAAKLTTLFEEVDNFQQHVMNTLTGFDKTTQELITLVS
jgi:hypothetical protein